MEEKLRFPPIGKSTFAVFICLTIGYLGGMVTKNNLASWYDHLNQPFLNPPNWAYGPVWAVLFIMMGISAGMIWNQPESKERNSCPHHFWYSTRFECRLATAVFRPSKSGGSPGRSDSVHGLFGVHQRFVFSKSGQSPVIYWCHMFFGSFL